MKGDINDDEYSGLESEEDIIVKNADFLSNSNLFIEKSLRKDVLKTISRSYKKSKRLSYIEEVCNLLQETRVLIDKEETRVLIDKETGAKIDKETIASIKKNNKLRELQLELERATMLFDERFIKTPWISLTR